jgi:hypothetical protein
MAVAFEQRGLSRQRHAVAIIGDGPPPFPAPRCLPRHVCTPPAVLPAPPRSSHIFRSPRQAPSRAAWRTRP